MSGALLGRDTERQFRNAQIESQKKRSPKLAKFGQTLLLSLICLFSALSVGAGATAKAAIWDLGDQIVAGIMNICNPNSVPYTTDTKSWFDRAIGATYGRPKAPGENNGGNIWSTYNPMVKPDGSVYITTVDQNMNPKTPTNAEESTRAWIKLLRSKNGDQFLYADNWSDRSKIDAEKAEWWGMFRGDGDRNMYPADPGSNNAAYYNAPTVALQSAYANAPSWVKHPTYTRYGFETLEWTVYGSSCYAPERYMNVIPSGLYWFLVQIPTLITFGMLRITLGGEMSNLFYMFVYPLTRVFSTFLTPWVALIAIFIGLPFVWIKSKGSIQKILGGAVWISAMLFAMAQLSANAQKFTEFSQGLVVKVSGTMACTIANQAFTDTATTITYSSDEVKSEQYVPKYDASGNILRDANGNTQYETVQQVEDRMRTAAARDGAKTNGGAVLTLNDLKGVSNNPTTPCGSYLDGIYNAYWLGVPLQVWAEGEVGGAQAARDRVSESKGRVGWYQAILNSMYINPEDNVGRAQIQATARWNDGGYTAKFEDKYWNVGKPAQWSLDGHSDENPWNVPVTALDHDKTATVWKTVPFLLNIKFLCKDDQVGTTEKEGLNGADNAGDYAGNKWMYDGTCITGGDIAVINGIKGYNFVDRIGLAVIGGILAVIIFYFTVAMCVYILYQKFIWGFMLLFAPIFLGIAAFPDEKRRDFFRKYVEFCISNVIKQIAAVLILVVTVTALGRIVFPNASSIGDMQFYVPWMLKPFVALAFMISAVMFAFPMKKIMVGAVKGDSSVVGKTADSIGDGMKTAAGLAAAAAVAVGTGGVGAAGMGSALLKGAGKAAQGMAMRKGGMTGVLAAAAGDAALGKAANIDENLRNKAAAAGIDMGKGGLFSQLKAGRAMKNAGVGVNPKSTKGLAQNAALAANKLAAAKGEALPYAVDSKGNLTPAARKQAMKDFVRGRKGNFAALPEFSAIARNKEANAKKLAAARASLLPQFTDAEGNVDEKGLNAAAQKQVAAENKNMLSRQEKLGKQMLEEDKAKKPEDRKYLDAKGNLSPEGARALMADARAADSNAVNIANNAKAAELMSKNPDYYNKFVTPENPNGNWIAARADANRLNFGANGAIGDNPIHVDALAAGMPVQTMNGTQAYVANGAPMVGTDLTPAKAAAEVQAIGAKLEKLSPDAQKALSTYSETLANPNSTPEQIQKAHAAALTAVHGEKGLTDGSRMAQTKVIDAVTKHDMNLAPDTIRAHAEALPESSVALRQTMNNYAAAVEAHGIGSQQAQQALTAVQTAASHEDAGVYAAVAKSMPMPAGMAAGVDGGVTVLASGGTSSTPTLAPSVKPEAAVVDASAENQNWVQAARTHYGLEPSNDLKNGAAFTEAEAKGIREGSIKPVAGTESLAASVNAAPMREAAAKEASGTINLEETRAAARAELGLAPDNAPASAPLMTQTERAQVRERQALAQSMAATTGDGSGVIAAPTANVDDVTKNYVSTVRDHFGLKENNALQSGAALTAREVADVQNQTIVPTSVKEARDLRASVTTPDEVRQMKREELGLARDKNDATAPLMTDAEQATVTQMQALGVRLGDTGPSAARSAEPARAMTADTAESAPSLAPEARRGIPADEVVTEARRAMPTAELSESAGEARRGIPAVETEARRGIPASDSGDTGSYDTPVYRPIEGATASTGGRTIEGAVQLTPQAETVLAQKVAERGDGSQYVNGMIVNPQSSSEDLGRAVSTLPESHPAQQAMTQYSSALSNSSAAPEVVTQARNEVLTSLGMPTEAPTEARRSADYLPPVEGVLGGEIRNIPTVIAAPAPTAPMDAPRSDDRGGYSEPAGLTEVRHSEPAPRQRDDMSVPSDADLSAGRSYSSDSAPRLADQVRPETRSESAPSRNYDELPPDPADYRDAPPARESRSYGDAPRSYGEPIRSDEPRSYDDAPRSEDRSYDDQPSVARRAAEPAPAAESYDDSRSDEAPTQARRAAEPTGDRGYGDAPVERSEAPVEHSEPRAAAPVESYGDRGADEAPRSEPRRSYGDYDDRQDVADDGGFDVAMGAIAAGAIARETAAPEQKTEARTERREADRGGRGERRDRDRNEDREEREERPEEEVVSEETAGEEYSDEPARYERENGDDRPNERREMFVQLTAAAQELEKNQKMINQKGSLYNIRRAEHARLVRENAPQSEIKAALNNALGLQKTMEKLMEEKSRIQNRIDDLKRRLGEQ